jgi:hypothetical protein
MEANGRIRKTDWSPYLRLNQIKAKIILEQQACWVCSLNSYQKEMTHVSIWNWNQYCWYKVIHGTRYSKITTTWLQLLLVFALVCNSPLLYLYMTCQSLVNVTCHEFIK